VTGSRPPCFRFHEEASSGTNLAECK
jgi:hypothetical protein